MFRRALAAVLLGGVALAGCTASGTSPDGTVTPSRADELWKQRTDFVGDNSRVIWLTRAAGFGPDGSYTISLQTATKPYGVTITFDTPTDKATDKPFDQTDFASPSTLLLGTIGNLDAVHVKAADRSFDLTAAQATKQLGYDVKTLGRDQKKLTAYVDTLAD
ncbi:DUF4825 domain-containing protein [Terrabacter sp. 2RAF25]|uniref:DUF4825 domain-containing protein n=1 Tax=Terrabacter sp. 2RAF25 TaxID=3232998 RepID=UPI003F9495B2